MKAKVKYHPNPEMERLCLSIRALVNQGSYEDGKAVICEFMQRHPHAPQPHNLLGILLEKTGDHATAMRHFRAALALEPTYAPAAHNLNTYGTFFSHGACAFDEKDLEEHSPDKAQIIYARPEIDRFTGKTRIEYDENGIGHVRRR